MSTLDDINSIDNQIKKLNNEIYLLQTKKNELIKQFYSKNKTKIYKYSPYKNSHILITKNDIECENEIDISDYEISSENTSE